MNIRAILTAILMTNRIQHTMDITSETKNGMQLNSAGRQLVERCVAVADEIINQTREQ